MQYQHAIPQEEQDHEIVPIRRFDNREYCQECGKEARRFRDNEGPEALKALLWIGPPPRVRRRRAKGRS